MVRAAATAACSTTRTSSSDSCFSMSKADCAEVSLLCVTCSNTEHLPVVVLMSSPSRIDDITRNVRLLVRIAALTRGWDRVVVANAGDRVNPSFPGVFPFLLVLLGLALLGTLAGVRLGGLPGVSRRVLPFSGGLLVGVAGFWILPEIAAHLGWAGALAGLTAGFGLLW